MNHLGVEHYVPIYTGNFVIISRRRFLLKYVTFIKFPISIMDRRIVIVNCYLFYVYIFTFITIYRTMDGKIGHLAPYGPKGSSRKRKVGGYNGAIL